MHMHGAVKDLVACVAVGLGLIHGIVRIAQDLFRAGVVEGAEGDPDTGGNENLMTIQIDGQANIVLGAVGDRGYIGNIGDVLEEDGEGGPPKRATVSWGRSAPAGVTPCAPAAHHRWRGRGYRSPP